MKNISENAARVTELVRIIDNYEASLHTFEKKDKFEDTANRMSYNVKKTIKGWFLRKKDIHQGCTLTSLYVGYKEGDCDFIGCVDLDADDLQVLFDRLKKKQQVCIDELEALSKN